MGDNVELQPLAKALKTNFLKFHEITYLYFMGGKNPHVIVKGLVIILHLCFSMGIDFSPTPALPLTCIGCVLPFLVVQPYL